MRSRMTQVLVPIVAAGLLVLGLIAVGKAARDRLRQESRYTFGITDIDCPEPPGLRRDEFLAEVQYLANLPDRLPSLDEDTAARLAGAFAQHPWVEKVEEVCILPPDRARVRLAFRTPVLVVPQPTGPRVVDGRGVLLPAAAPSDNLPTLQGEIASPAGLAGSLWGDASVSAAAAVVDTLRPHRERLELTGCEVRDGIVELNCGRIRVVWGSAPGVEKTGEAPAGNKLQRLLETCGKPGGLDASDLAALDLR
jgi:hypothetical protein